MFYDYTEILEADYFQTHRGIAEDLAMQILISVLKGDQNYHYENIAFVCDASGQILRLVPMIDHEFSTCFMFPDNLSRHNYWFGELQRSIEGKPVQPDEYKDFPNEKERRLMEKSATCLHRNLVYIKEHYPEVTASFRNVSRLKRDLLQKRESFLSEKQKIIRIMQIRCLSDRKKPDTKITMKKRRQLSKNSTAEKEKKYPLIL